MNKVILTGRLGRDAEAKEIGGQWAVSFSLATSETYKDKDGQRQEKTEWHSCTMWGDRSKAIAQYLTKGKMIGVEGSVHYRETEKDGVRTRYTDIRVTNVEFLGGGQQQEQPKPEPKQSAVPGYKISEQPFHNPATQSDLPF